MMGGNTYDGSGNLVKVGADTSEEEHKKTLGTERKAFTASAAKPAVKPLDEFPKQTPNEDPAAYAARVRAFREKRASGGK